MSEPTGVKMSHAKTRIPKLKEYILVYKKGDIKINSVRVPKEKWDNEYKTYEFINVKSSLTGNIYRVLYYREG